MYFCEKSNITIFQVLNVTSEKYLETVGRKVEYMQGDKQDANAAGHQIPINKH